jgi:predicted P-loop ATPase
MDYKRQFVICGTTNKEQFLLDETGNARFYIVPVKRKLTQDDYVTVEGVEYIKSIKENIEQIYAEGLTLYKESSLKLSGEANRIVERIRDNSFSRDEIEETIVQWLDNIPEDCKSFASKEKVQVNDILIHCLKETPSKARGLSNRIGNILRRLGYTAKSYRIDDKVKYGFVKNV